VSSHIHELTDGAVYLDTMVLYSYLRMTDPDVANLFQRIEDGVQAFTATLTFDELAYRLLLGLIRDKYGKSPLDRLRQAQAVMIDEFYALIEPQLVALQHFPNFTVVPVTTVDLAAMHRNVRQFHLLPRDALHLSVMQRVGCTNLISEDSDFDEVDGIHRFTVR
jgi:predicted nucleic acid-binding protein